MRDLWTSVHGKLDRSCMVEMINPLRGLVIDNLYIRHKEGHNVLSEKEFTGLTGIRFDKVHSVYYIERHRQRIQSSVNSDWRVTLNHRLRFLDHKWLRPAVPYDNTPHDVWEYICRVPAGYHTGTIEDVTSSNSQSIEIVDNPRFALFEE